MRLLDMAVIRVEKPGRTVTSVSLRGSAWLATRIQGRLGQMGNGKIYFVVVTMRKT